VKKREAEEGGEKEEIEREDDCAKPMQQQPPSHNFDVDKDELRALACDEDEEEGLPYEMVFKVNLTSSLSSSSKRQPNSQTQPVKRARKGSLSSSSSCTSPTLTSRCSIPNKTSKDTSTERRVLEKLQQDVEGMFLFESAGDNSNNTNILDGHKSPVSMMLEEHMVDCGEAEEETLAEMTCDYWTQQGFALAAQQQTLFASPNNTSNAINNSALHLYLNNTNSPSAESEDNNNLGSFMFLRTEPMILAQEERLGRNPYFIRTPPQVRRGSAGGGVQPAAMAMEEETSW